MKTVLSLLHQVKPFKRIWLFDIFSAHATAPRKKSEIHQIFRKFHNSINILAMKHETSVLISLEEISTKRSFKKKTIVPQLASRNSKGPSFSVYFNTYFFLHFQMENGRMRTAPKKCTMSAWKNKPQYKCTMVGLTKIQIVIQQSQ